MGPVDAVTRRNRTPPARAVWMEGSECATGVIPANPLPSLLSALGFFLYNFLSLVCLLMLNAVTHSIANSLRRRASQGSTGDVTGVTVR